MTGDYDPADRCVVSVLTVSMWNHTPAWRYVGDAAHHGRMVRTRAEARVFPSLHAAQTWAAPLLIDNAAHLRGWKIQTLDGKTVDRYVPDPEEENA